MGIDSGTSPPSSPLPAHSLPQSPAIIAWPGSSSKNKKAAPPVHPPSGKPSLLSNLGRLFHRGPWLEEVEELEDEEEEEGEGWWDHMLHPLSGGRGNGGFLSVATRVLALSAVLLALAWTPGRLHDRLGEGGGGGGGGRGKGLALKMGGGPRNLVRRLFGREGPTRRGLLASRAVRRSSGDRSKKKQQQQQQQQQQQPCPPVRPRLGDPSQLNCVEGCMRALDKHVRAEDAPRVFAALKSLTSTTSSSSSSSSSSFAPSHPASLAKIMAVEDWLGEWLDRTAPSPPLDLLEGALDYAVCLSEGEGEEGGQGDRQARRGTAMERLVVARTFKGLLGPRMRERGGGMALMQACRLAGRWSRWNRQLRRKLLHAPLHSMWARLAHINEPDSHITSSRPSSFPMRPRGLRNQGNTCYFNSLLQQLFNTKATRKSLLLLKGGEGGREKGVVEALSAREEETWKADKEGQRLWAELEGVMEGLGEEGKEGGRGVDTRALVQALAVALPEWGDEVWEQNDSTEVLMFLLERLGGGVGGRALASCFRGRLQDRIYQEGCGHERVKTQAFITLPVPVREGGVEGGLVEALREWTRGGEMGGGRKGGKACAVCEVVSGVWHEETLVELPPVVACQLQRFEFAVDARTGVSRSEKVGGRFPFPMVLDMWPYTREGKARSQKDPQGVGEGEREGGEEDVVPRAWYRLVGVLMHRGSSPQEGHYYSYVRREGGREEGGGWWCVNDEVVTAFDPAKEAEKVWFVGGYDCPFMLLYEKEEEEEEEEEEEQGTGVRGGFGGGSLLPAPVHSDRLGPLIALVTGLTSATLYAPPLSSLSSLPSSPSASHVLIPDVQRLLELFHWLASSPAKMRREGAKEQGREGGGAMEAVLLKEIKESAGLLRRFLLSPSRNDKAKEGLAHWLLLRLGTEGGWIDDIFLRPSSLPSSSSSTPLQQGLVELWMGVAEAALDRVTSQSPSSPQVEEAVQSLGAVLFSEEGQGGREGWRGDGLEVLRERVRPFLNVLDGKLKRARKEEQREEEEGMEEEEGRRRAGGEGGKKESDGQGAADAG
ncbi:ubiquitin domain-containing protein [Nannochloropsis oceanica]